MKKTIKRFLCVVMCFVLILPFALSAAAAGIDTGFTQEDFLVTKGNKIYNQKGEEIILRGVNRGSCLIQEYRLSPYEEVQDHHDMLEVLIDRFGTERAYALMNTYQDNWITEYDLDQIKEMGFNCVRVPLWYRNFYSDDNGTKILDKNGEWDFRYLDWIVEECSKRQIYVILDMHGAPGFQSDAPHSGKRDSCRLYENSEQGEFFRTLADELWTAIA